MARSFLVRIKGDDTTYHVDLAAGLVSPVDCAAHDLPSDMSPDANRDIEFVAVCEARTVAASFPLFSDP